ncbi:MAG: helix-turn-helix transcriptional regulator [Fulvivirga sp.]|uniref:helix-turn-helix domain-containing protein n=1 Tax=Fulvivirga sp. TaxID=1931237 RepID=UPI0032ED3E7C
MSIKGIPVRHIKASNADQEVLEHFSIRKVQQLTYKQDLSQDLHRHDFYFIIAIEKGSGSHAIDFKHYGLCDHCIFFMRPGQVHELLIKAESTGFLMQFKPDFYPSGRFSKDLLRSLSHQTFCQLSEEQFHRLKTILDNLNTEYQEKQVNFGEALKAGLTIFFIELLRNKTRPDDSTDQNIPYQQDRLEEFLSLVESQLVDHKDVSYYIDQLNLSTFQLNAITKKLLDKTASELIDEQVILESKRHLLATSDQVNQIAYKLGYDDPSYFIRFFKKHTGHSPQAFRQNFR